MALQKGLVGHWTMNSEDTDNGKIRDRSAYDNHGTLQGNPSTGNFGIIGDAYEFDGNDDYIDMGDPDLYNDLAAITVSVWIYRNSDQQQTYFAKEDDDGGTDMWGIRQENSSDIRYYVRTDDGSFHDIQSIASSSTGEWVHFALTWDKSTSTLTAYENSVIVDTTSTSSGNLDTEPANAKIGIRDADNLSRPLDGRATDARIYNRALSQSEITQLYNQRSKRTHGMTNVPVAQQDLVAYYPFASSGATDQSGSGQQTTIHQNPVYEEQGGAKGNGTYNFVGNNGYIGIDNWNYFSNLSNESWTAAAWVYPNTVNTGSCSDKFTNGDIFAQGGAFNDTFYFHICGGDKVGLYLDGSSGQLTSSSNTISAKQWYHVVATSDPNDGLKLYVDGKLEDTDSVTSIASSGSPVWIGAEDNHNSYFDGKISDARIYNRGLSKYEVKRLYQSEGNVFGGRIRRTVYQGNDVVVEEDQYGTWLLVMNYEHYRNEDPTISRASSFPQMPNGVPKISDVDSFGTSGEMKHVDNISQYGITDVGAVRLEGLHKDHNRKMNYFTENQTAIDAIVDDSTKAGSSALSSPITKYSDHTANLPDAGNKETNNRTAHIFGYEFPIYGSDGISGGNDHWSIGEGRWEMDNSSTNTSIHRVWVRI